MRLLSKQAGEIFPGIASRVSLKIQDTAAYTSALIRTCLFSSTLKLSNDGMYCMMTTYLLFHTVSDVVLIFWNTAVRWLVANSIRGLFSTQICPWNNQKNNNATQIIFCAQIMLMHANLFFLSAYGTITPLPLPTRQ